MKSVPHRGALTDIVLAQVASHGFPVGDGQKPPFDPAAPQNAGWEGDPGAPGSVYVPYNVVTPQTATTSSGPFNDPQDSWQMPYSLASFGLGRGQCEAIANKARKALRALKGTDVTLDDEVYRIQQVKYDAIGGTGRVDEASPSIFGEIDTVTIWITQ